MLVPTSTTLTPTPHPMCYTQCNLQPLPPSTTHNNLTPSASLMMNRLHPAVFNHHEIFAALQITLVQVQ